MDLQVKAATDIGLRRPQNEDHYALWIPSVPAVRARRGVLLVVADGMGGAQAGEVASHMAVERLLEAWRTGQGEPLEDLRHAVEAANRAVHVESLTHPERQGMGTTLTALVVRGHEALVAHVGDSRAWLVRDGAARQLTVDHTLVAQLVRDGHITAEEARVDPRRNVVTRSVGVAPDVRVDVARVPEPLREGDTLVLSTDGLHGLVSDAELAERASQPDLAAACDALVALARERGGPDNITVVVARVVS